MTFQILNVAHAQESTGLEFGETARSEGRAHSRPLKTVSACESIQSG